MKKLKFLAVILAVVMLSAVLVLPAGARTVGGNGAVAPCYDFRYTLALAVAEAANDSIEAIVVRAQNNPYADADRVVAATEAISAAAVFTIRLLGYDAICEYVEYEINGQTVLIDPLIVIKR